MSLTRKKSYPDYEKPDDSSKVAENDPNSGIIRFEVDKISTLDQNFKCSPEVQVAELFWKAAVRKTERDGEDFLSLYLIGVDHKKKRRTVKMKYDHSLINSKGRKIIVKNRVKEFNRHHARRGFKIVEWKKLMDQKEGFVKHDKITAEIRFSILNDSVVANEGNSVENEAQLETSSVKDSLSTPNMLATLSRNKSELVSKVAVTKKNIKKLGCEECDYRTRSAAAWEVHLRTKHSTTPVLAGLALLCDCGNESLTFKHSRECQNGNVTIIRKRDGPILRMTDKKLTPKCVLCEAYPKTAHGYMEHLRQHPIKTTLRKNNIYLKCSCGLVIRGHSDCSSANHSKECNPRLFTLHKLYEN